MSSAGRLPVIQGSVFPLLVWFSLLAPFMLSSQSWFYWDMFLLEVFGVTFQFFVSSLGCPRGAWDKAAYKLMQTWATFVFFVICQKAIWNPLLEYESPQDSPQWNLGAMQSAVLGSASTSPVGNRAFGAYCFCKYIVHCAIRNEGGRHDLRIKS